MKNDMKVIMENWRRLQESEDDWNQSKDNDSSKKVTLIVFDEGDISAAESYPDESGKNHGLISHANKHAIEFGLNFTDSFMNYVQRTLDSGKSVYVRTGGKKSQSKIFLPVDSGVLNNIRSKDKESMARIKSQGSNPDMLYNVFFGDESQKLAVAKTSIDFYHDIGNEQMVDTLMGTVDQKYGDLAMDHHKDCKNTYSDQETSKTWCVDDGALSISYGNKLSTLYKPKSIEKALAGDRTLTNLIDKLQQTGNEKEIEKVKSKLKL
jgi:hypothetical protein